MGDYVNTYDLSELLNFVDFFADSDFRQALSVVKTSVLTLSYSKVLPIALAIAIIRMVWKKYQQNGKPGVDQNELITIVVIVIMIPMSVLVMSTISRIADGIAVSYTAQRTASLNSFYKYTTVNRVANEEDLSEEESKDLYRRLTGSSSADKQIVQEFLTERYQADDSVVGAVMSAINGEVSIILILICIKSRALSLYHI